MVSFSCRLFAQLLFALAALKPFIDPFGRASLLGSEYIGTGAPLFPLEASGTATCYQYFFALAEANCTTHQSDILPVRVHNCVADAASGVLVLERTNDPSLLKGDEGGTAIYRLRVAGPDGFWVLEPTYCRPDFALAMYDFRNPGNFSIEVLMLYTSFSFVQPNISKAVQAPWAGYLTLDVHPLLKSDVSSSSYLDGSRDVNRLYLARQTWTCSPDKSILSNLTLVTSGGRRRHVRSENETSLRLCPDTGPLPGRWYFAEWPPDTDATIAATAALLRTCVWYTPHDSDADCNNPERRQLPFESYPATLSWQPDGCRMRTFTSIPAAAPLPPPPPLPTAAGAAAEPPLAPAPITPQTCLRSGRRVCFVGDSHMRYLLNSLVLWQRDFRITVNNTAKELLSSENVHYEYMRWGHDWPISGDANGTADPLAAANCTDIIANFGQWPASYRSGSAPYSALQYLHQLLYVRRALLEARRARSVRVFWVTTCISSLKARLEMAGIDWRTDPLLTLYNRLALDVMSGQLLAALVQTRTRALGALGPNVASGEQQQQQQHIATGGSLLDDGRRLYRHQSRRLHKPSQLLPWATREGQGESGQKGTQHQADSSVGQQQQQQQRWKLRRRGHTQVHTQTSLTRSLGQEQVEEQVQQRQAYFHSRGRSHSVSSLSSSSSSSATSTTTTTTSSSQSLMMMKWLEEMLLLQGRRRLMFRVQAEVEAEVEAEAATSRSAAPSPESIPVIDTWSFTRILHDTTWDGVHYTNTGAVGLAQLTAVLHALCSETILGKLQLEKNTNGGQEQV